MHTAKILLLSDEIFPAYYQNYTPGVFDGIDLIISCGDLKASYLTFIADVFRGPVLYVPGNHDEQYLENPPLGCIDIDGRIFVWNGLRILGLGGSSRYKPGPYQYTEKEMKRRIAKLWYQLMRYGGIDILVTHSPAKGLNDGTDPCHTGFECFINLIEKYQPAYFFHGHVHLNYGNYPRCCRYENTVVVNGFQRYILEVPLPEPVKKKKA